MKKVLCLLFTFLMTSQLHSSTINWSSSSTVISGGLFNASDPHVVTDPNGNSTAVWVESNLIKSSSKPVHGSWGTIATLSAVGASSPNIVSDNNGNMTTVWVENGVIKASTKPFNGSWSTSTSLSSTTASSPTICVDSAGDVIVAWIRSNNIESSTKLFGGNWQPKVVISSSSAVTPCIAVGGTGSGTTAVIVWQGVSGGSTVIYATSKLISGAWSSAQIISETIHNAAQPSVAVDGNGNATAAWYAYDISGLNYENVIVKSASRLSALGAWGSISSISQPGLRNPSGLHVRVKFDGAGNTVAFWNTSFNDETFNIESAVKPLNDDWSSPVDLLTNDLYAYSAELSSTASGNVVGLYTSYNGSSLSIESVESNINGYLNNLWSVPITISSGIKNAFPKISATISGNTMNATVVWVHFNGSLNVISAISGSKTLVLPPSNLLVTQGVNNFGVFNEYFNTLSWTASTDPNLDGYAIFRNGVFIAQVGADVLSYVDDNRTLNGSVTYTVTAIDSQQSQSVPVSVSFP